jgi:hypothetical protein
MRQWHITIKDRVLRLVIREGMIEQLFKEINTELVSDNKTVGQWAWIAPPNNRLQLGTLTPSQSLAAQRARNSLENMGYTDDEENRQVPHFDPYGRY